MSTPLEYSQKRYRIQKLFKEYQFFYLSFKAIYEQFDERGKRDYKVFEDKFPINFSKIEDLSFDQREQAINSLIKKYIDLKYDNFYSNSLKKDHVWWKIIDLKQNTQLDFAYDFENEEVVVLSIIYKDRFLIPDFENEFNYKIKYRLVHINAPGIDDCRFYTIKGIKNLMPLFGEETWDFEFIDFKFGPSSDDIIRIFNRDQLVLDKDIIFDKKTGKTISRNFYNFDNETKHYSNLDEFYENVINIYKDKNFSFKLLFGYFTEPTHKNVAWSLIYKTAAFKEQPTIDQINATRIFIFNKKYSHLYNQWSCSSPRLDDYDYPHKKGPSPINSVIKGINPDIYFFDEYISDNCNWPKVDNELLNKLICLEERQEGKLYKLKELNFNVQNDLFSYLSSQEELKALRFEYILFLFETSNLSYEKGKALQYLIQLCKEGDQRASFFYKNWKICSNLTELK